MIKKVLIVNLNQNSFQESNLISRLKMSEINFQILSYNHSINNQNDEELYSTEENEENSFSTSLIKLNIKEFLKSYLHYRPDLIHILIPHRFELKHLFWMPFFLLIKKMKHPVCLTGSGESKLHFVWANLFDGIEVSDIKHIPRFRKVTHNVFQEIPVIDAEKDQWNHATNQLMRYYIKTINNIK